MGDGVDKLKKLAAKEVAALELKRGDDFDINNDLRDMVDMQKALAKGALKSRDAKSIIKNAKVVKATLEKRLKNWQNRGNRLEQLHRTVLSIKKNQSEENLAEVVRALNALATKCSKSLAKYKRIHREFKAAQISATSDIMDLFPNEGGVSPDKYISELPRIKSILDNLFKLQFVIQRVERAAGYALKAAR